MADISNVKQWVETTMRRDIGWRIKEIRQRQLEMTQEEFSDLIGSTQAQVSRIEKGKALPTIEMLIVISKLSGKTTDWILKGYDE